MMNSWQPCCELMNERTGICSIHGRYGDFVASTLRTEAKADLELEQRALEACGYRVHVKERNGTRWLMAVKGLGVRYEHWHPLTNINQAMQLLCELPTIPRQSLGVTFLSIFENLERPLDGKRLVIAQCRAIVTACASLKPVR